MLRTLYEHKDGTGQRGKNLAMVVIDLFQHHFGAQSTSGVKSIVEMTRGASLTSLIPWLCLVNWAPLLSYLSVSMLLGKILK
jgi:hypothetical protein